MSDSTQIRLCAQLLQVLSGDHLLFLDPHACHLGNECPSIRGSLRTVAREAGGQLQPFLKFTQSCPAVPTCDPDCYFPGTVFRLALRTAETAQHSSICTDVITAEELANDTLKKFQDSAPDLLLFLRHVRKISVYVKDSADCEAKLVHECTADIHKLPGQVSDSNLALSEASIRIICQDHPHTTEHWARATNLASIGGNDGVAILLNQHSADKVAAEVESISFPVVEGKVYATMPLPCDVTGLPVHINGSFHVQSDRRNLWSGDGDKGKVGWRVVELYHTRLVCRTVAVVS